MGYSTPLIVAPVSALSFGDATEGSEFRKQLMGDGETREVIQRIVTEVLTSAFENAAARKTMDQTPWPVTNLSKKDKAAANAAYARAMSGAALDKRLTEGLDSTPKLELNADLDGECGKADPSWSDFWNAEFVRQGWVKRDQGLALYHYMNCQWVQYLGMGGYYHLLDAITLYESNVAFELNGKYFRKPAALFSSHRMMTTMGVRLEQLQQAFIPRSIMQFFTDLTLGKRTVPVIQR